MRCGVIRTRGVTQLTTILLLRARYLLQQPERSSLLSEEVIVEGLTGGTKGDTHAWLAEGEALRLLAEAKPEANVPMTEKRLLAKAALDVWPALAGGVAERIRARVSEVEKS